MIAALHHKGSRLFLILGCFFVGNALIAECIGVKIFSLESTFGKAPVNWTVFGVENLSFNLTAGVLLWPLVFVMTDIINEYFGPKGVWLACLFQGAAETTLYVIALYFGSVNIKNTRYTLGIMLLVDLVCVITGIFVCVLYF